MNELEEFSEDTSLEPYERGLSLARVLRGTLARFLPASVLSTGIGIAVMGAPGGGPLLDFVLVVMFGIVLPMAVGFGLGLEAMRRWLFPDADVDGRRSFITVLMFFAWLTPTPEEMRRSFAVDSQPSPEKRIEFLESSLQRIRRLVVGLAVLRTLFVSAAFVLDEDEVRTKKPVLLESELLGGVVLVAGEQSSLVIQTPGGEELLTLGGHPARFVGEAAARYA